MAMLLVLEEVGGDFNRWLNRNEILLIKAAYRCLPPKPAPDVDPSGLQRNSAVGLASAQRNHPGKFNVQPEPLLKILNQNLLIKLYLPVVWINHHSVIKGQGKRMTTICYTEMSLGTFSRCRHSIHANPAFFPREKVWRVLRWRASNGCENTTADSRVPVA